MLESLFKIEEVKNERIKEHSKFVVAVNQLDDVYTPYLFISDRVSYVEFDGLTTINAKLENYIVRFRTIRIEVVDGETGKVLEKKHGKLALLGYDGKKFVAVVLMRENPLKNS